MVMFEESFLLLLDCLWIIFHNISVHLITNFILQLLFLGFELQDTPGSKEWWKKLFDSRAWNRRI